jgi:hypothetical protein
MAVCPRQWLQPGFNPSGKKELSAPASGRVDGNLTSAYAMQCDGVGLDGWDEHSRNDSQMFVVCSFVEDNPASTPPRVGSLRLIHDETVTCSSVN